MGSPSAWTARVPGATTSSSSGSGDRSSTRRSTFELTTRSPRPAPRSARISASTTPADRIRALTGGRRIKPTSLACRRSRRPEPGRHSTYQAGKPVQTNRASSGVLGECLRRYGLVPAWPDVQRLLPEYLPDAVALKTVQDAERDTLARLRADLVQASYRVPGRRGPAGIVAYD